MVVATVATIATVASVGVGVVPTLVSITSIVATVACSVACGSTMAVAAVAGMGCYTLVPCCDGSTSDRSSSSGSSGSSLIVESGPVSGSSTRDNNGGGSNTSDAGSIVANDAGCTSKASSEAIEITELCNGSSRSGRGGRSDVSIGEGDVICGNVNCRSLEGVGKSSVSGIGIDTSGSGGSSVSIGEGLVPCGSIDILSKGDSGGCGRSSRSLEGVGEDTVGGGSVDTTGRTGSLVSIGEGEVVTVSFRTVGLDAGKAGTVGSSSGIGSVSSVLTLSSSTGIGVTLSLSCTNLVLLVAEGNSTGIGLRAMSPRSRVFCLPRSDSREPGKPPSCNKG